MTRIFRALLIAALLLAPVPALAQSSPGLVFGQVPTAAQWNSYFAAKQDVLGYTPVNKAGDTMTGRLTTVASAAGSAGIRLPAGAAPSSPVNGDLWTTTSGIYVRINGATVGPLTGGTSAGFAATSPLAVTFPVGVVTYACATCATTTSGGALSATAPVTISSAGLIAITANGISDTLIRQGVARSVIGVTGNATANVADIQGTASQFFGINAAGTALAFQTMAGDATLSGATITIGNAAVSYAKFQNIAALSVAGRSASSSGVGADITLTANQFLGVNAAGTTLEGQTLAGDATLSGPTITIGTNVVTNAKSAQAAANTLKGNATTSTANVADFTITSLTLKASPVAGDLILLEDSQASGALKRVTAASIAGVGTVASIAGNTGAFTLSTGITNSTNDIRLDLAYAPTWTAQHIHTVTRSVASATAAELDDFKISAATTTITGNTGSPITLFNKVGIYRPTFTDASAVTITNAASLYIENAPLAAGSVTLTNTWALRVGAGATSLQATTIGGAITYGGVTLSNSVSGTGGMVLVTSPTINTPSFGGLSVATPGSFLCYNTGTGAVTSNTSTCLVSDERLKTNWGASPGLQAVMALHPGEFDWIDVEQAKQGRQIGLKAQDVRRVVPLAVQTSGDTLIRTADGGRQTIHETQAVDYAKLVVPLIRAVQEQQSQIEAMQRQLYRR